MNTSRLPLIILTLTLLLVIPTSHLNSFLFGGGEFLSMETNLPGVVQGIPGATEEWWMDIQNGIDEGELIKNTTPLKTSPSWTDEGDQSSAYFGYSVGTAGDVNGDGYADVIVGAHGYYNGQDDEGRVYVYHGSASGLSTNPDWFVEGNQIVAELGYSVGTAGDVNGDGYSDVIVGARRYTNGEQYEGGAFVYHGSETGLSTTPDWTAEGDEENAWFGISVGTAGDVNGDGYSDVIVGASHEINSQVYESQVYVYHGSETGLSSIADWTEDIDQDDAHFGDSVGTAGDVNGDGFSDVIVGAPLYDNGQTDEGGVFVYYGSETGLPSDPDWSAESNQADAFFGLSVGTAGDVNNDGYAEVIVGASYYTNGETGEGRAYVFHGSNSGLSTTANWTAESNQSEAHFGTSVWTAGDVNNDGYSDVLVGAPRYNNNRNDEGRAYLYTGSATGLSTTVDWFTDSNVSFAYYGHSVGTAGDVNGNGYSDVIVGAYGFEDSFSFQGKAYVYHDSVGVEFSIYLPQLVKNAP